MDAHTRSRPRPYRNVETAQTPGGHTQAAPAVTVQDTESPYRSGHTENERREMIGDTRGQTTFDFAIGVSLFLVVLVFVFLFVPDLLEPFASGTQEETVAVNRVADELSQRMLGDPSEPYIVSQACVVAFFDNAAPGSCNYDGTTVDEQFNLEFRQHVNVTVTAIDRIDARNPDDILCWDSASERFVPLSGSCNPSSGDVPLQTGESIAQGSTSSVSARRVVVLDNRTVSIKVVMW